MSCNLTGERQEKAGHPFSEIITCVASVFELSEDLLCSGSRNRRGAWGRAVVGYLGRELGKYRLKDIAEHFRRDPAVMSQGLKKVEERFREDDIFKKVILRLKEKLTQKRRKYLIT